MGTKETLKKVFVVFNSVDDLDDQTEEGPIPSLKGIYSDRPRAEKELEILVGEINKQMIADAQDIDGVQDSILRQKGPGLWADKDNIDKYYIEERELDKSMMPEE